ncbi:MAG: LysE family translocator [Pseudomonadota bacterium]
MTDLTTLLTFIAASVAILVVPGPTVTLIVANSLRFGTKAGLFNIAGTQFGITLMIVVLALGFEAVATFLAEIFEWLRLVGAAYLIWLGYKLLKSDGTMGAHDGPVKTRSNRGFFMQGFGVIISNPKMLFFFGAFLPQFIDPAGSAALQTLFFGFLFMALATVLDGAYAVAAGRAGGLLTRRNVRAVEVGGGSLLVGGGLWMALSRN